MTILVFGKTGQVATELSKLDGVTCVGRDVADLTKPDECAALVRRIGPDAVINAAAYTAVDRAEDEPDLAHLINGDAPGILAAAAASAGVPFVQISTDYVFDGSGEQAWKPDHPTGPLGVYGASKLAGETAVRQAGGQYAILRTSWVFSAHGSNFVKTMMRLGADREHLKIVADQFGGPTPASDIAKTCHAISRRLVEDQTIGGTYHYSGAPDVSWAEFAREIFRIADLSVEVTDIPSTEFPTKAMRPANSRLDCALTREVFGISRPNWRVALRTVLAELGHLNQESISR